MKIRTSSITILSATLLLATLALLPRITEAMRSKGLRGEKNLSVAPVLTSSSSQDQKSNVIVGASVHNDTSPPLRDMKQEKVDKKVEREANENPKVPASLKHKDSPDTVVQGFSLLLSLLAPNMPSPLLNFDGIPFPGVACNCAPPDTNGEVGLTQYVQIVNEGYQVFDKTTGSSLLGPSGITTLWSGFGGVCQNNGSGDPVVLYDQIANRWVITQFAGVSVPTDECIAVSTTSDATGSFNRYDFHLGSSFFDYPHLSVWPDAYYMSMNVFNSSGTAFLGPQPFAFDRAKMLLGLPATFVSSGITGGPSEDRKQPIEPAGKLGIAYAGYCDPGPNRPPFMEVSDAALERAKKRPQLEIRREEVTVAEMIERIRQVLMETPHAVRLDDLMAGYVTRQALVALLLALLEMVRLRAVVLRQKELFAPITIHRSKRFEEIMSQADAGWLQVNLEESFG